VNLKLDGADRTFERPLANPPLQDAELDSTVTITVVAGGAGSGKKNGGAGGDIINFVSESDYDQMASGGVYVNYVVLGVFAGPGGSATAGNGGRGEAITLSKPISGITYHDPHSSIFDPLSPAYAPNTPALFVVGGTGGDGTVKGGA